MANRRMFSLSVIDTDQFLNLPATAQNLYFHLCMRADDDGFVASPQKIIKFVGASSGDIQALIDNEYLIIFEKGIIVIRHWRLHNYIRADRKHDTIYSKEAMLLTTDDNGVYDLSTKCQTDVRQLTDSCPVEDRLGKDRIGKDSLGKDNNIVSKADQEHQELLDIYNETCTNLPKVLKITDKRKQEINKFLKEFSKEDFKTICENANNSEWLTGGNDRHWKADFSFLMRIDKATKLLEGGYAPKSTGNIFLDIGKDEGIL